MQNALLHLILQTIEYIIENVLSYSVSTVYIPSIDTIMLNEQCQVPCPGSLLKFKDNITQIKVRYCRTENCCDWKFSMLCIFHIFTRESFQIQICLTNVNWSRGNSDWTVTRKKPEYFLIAKNYVLQ